MLPHGTAVPADRGTGVPAGGVARGAPGHPVDRPRRRSCSRALLESDEPLSLRDLAEAADLPKSTASRLAHARSSATASCTRPAQRGKLEPGPAILRFAHRGGVERNLRRARRSPRSRRSRRPAARRSTSRCPRPTASSTSPRSTARHFLGAGQWVGRRVDYHCTANGKVFLAFGAAELPPGPLRAAARRARSSTAPRSTHELERVRRDGFATAVDELEAGLTALAAPVRGPTGDVIAALGDLGPDAAPAGRARGRARRRSSSRRRAR